MAITKDKKKALLATYVSDLKDATNAVIVKQTGIPVTLANKIRIELKTADGKMSILKKRIFLRALKDAGLEDVNVDVLEGSVFALYSKENEFGPLKVINKYLKEFKKENKKAEFGFIGGWFEKKWQDGQYVDDLANVPTKEELVAKLCYLFNYPLQSFACVISEIAKKLEAWSPKPEAIKEEVKEAIVPQGGEAKIEEVKSEEPKVEEVKTEETPAEEAKVEAIVPEGETPAAE